MMRYYLAMLLCATTAMADLGLPPPSAEVVCGPWNSGWDPPLDPLGDCRFERSNGRLTIRIPGKGHDLDFSKKQLNAPRLLRNVEGDFDVEVQVGGEFCPVGVSGEYRAGLFLTDGKNLSLKVVRVAVSEAVGEKEKTPTAPFCAELTRGDGCARSFYAYKKKSADLRLELLPSTRFEKPPILHLERRGTTLRVAVREDGKDWTPMKPPFDWLKDMELPQKLKIGVVAESTALGLFKPQFDEFKLTPHSATPSP